MCVQELVQRESAKAITDRMLE